jgi:hypothetical protein
LGETFQGLGYDIIRLEGCDVIRVEGVLGGGYFVYLKGGCFPPFAFLHPLPSLTTNTTTTLHLIVYYVSIYFDFHGGSGVDEPAVHSYPQEAQSC